MTIHQTLPTAIYLLAYDTRKNKLAKKAWLDYLVHGAALSELALDGYLTAIGGHAQATAVGEPADTVLGAVRDEIRRAGPRTWKQLLRSHAKQTLADVERQLAHYNVISAGHGGSVTGPVSPADVAAARSMHRSMHTILIGQGDTSGLPVRDAALAALAAVVPLPTVLSRREQRRHAATIGAVGDRAAAGSPAIRPLIAQMRRTRGRSFSAGGPAH